MKSCYSISSCSLINDIPVAHCSTHKKLGMYLAEKLNFGHHITEKIAKANKGTSVIKKLHNVLPRRSLLAIYKCFIKPNLIKPIDFISANQTVIHFAVK